MINLRKLIFLSPHDVYVFVGIFIMFLTPIVYFESEASVFSLSHLGSSILYALPSCFFLCSIKKKRIFYIISFVFMLTLYVEAIMVVLYGNFLTAGNILSIINTNEAEGGGFLKSILCELPMGLPVVLGWLMAVYIHKGKNRTIPFIIYGCTFFLLSFLFISYQLIVRWNGNITTRFYVEQNVLARPPYNSFYQMINAGEQIRNRSYITDAKNMSFGAKRENVSNKEAYVLFIGESLRYASLSLGEYTRSTTPLLESLDNVVLYNNYYSTATLTMYSVPQILTRATPDNFILNYKEGSIVRPFKECGFKVFTICAGNLLASEKYLSEGCDSIIAFGEHDDERIAPIVDSLVNIYPKSFFIVQGVGNHGPYTNFRRDQDIYHPNPVSDKVPWNNHEAMINAYDNTVLFTDYNAYNVIKAIDRKDTQSAFMFVSDHGADYDTGVSDHGGNCNPRKNEYHVPLIFWHSDLWGKYNKEKMEIVRKNKSLPINADNVFYSICDMAGISISCQYAKPQWSIFSKDISLHTRKILVPDGKNTIEVK